MLSATKSRNAGKPFLNILFFLSLILITVFPQDRIHRRVIPERPTPRDFGKYTNQMDWFTRAKGKRSLAVKTYEQQLANGIRNEQKEVYEDGFNAKDKKTTINKTLLSNGFQLIETIYQTWDGSNWLNRYRFSYTYDGNNNRTEELYQYWNGSAG